jgi:murein DD-endopeptidase MepM/ murein hydrolase activator NlpD
VASETGDQTQALAWAQWLFGAATILSPLTGLGLGFLAFVGCGPLYLCSLYHWTGLIATLLAFLAFFFLPLLVRSSVGDNDEYAALPGWGWGGYLIGVVLLWGLAWLISFLVLRGGVNLSDYKPKDHIYELPFPGGESSWVIQGNNSSLDHNDAHFGQKFSWDFRRNCGTPVLAARAGTILSFDDSHDGMGSGAQNNQILVLHSDMTVAFYLHIQKGSVPAPFRKIGAPVKQGDQIALAGSVGNSLTGHIHFMVRPGAASATTIGVSFTDVSDDNGIPRTFSSYTSGNRKVP